MTFKPFGVSAATIALVVGLGALASCGPAPQPTPAPPPPQAAVTPPPPAAKPMVMICKSSQTGLHVECGTPNAVMVGMKPAGTGSSAPR